MEKKQTAVQWLESLYYPEYIPKEIFEQAKAMEKEQMYYAYLSGSADNMNDECSFKDHYNETYGGGDESK